MKGFVGKQKIIYHKTLSYIRFTVGQYWLRIKKNGKNSVNFVNFRKFVVCHEKFWYVRKIFAPLKWYTDRNFFGDRGGGSSKINFSGKIFLSANFTLTPPLFSPPRFGPGLTFKLIQLDDMLHGNILMVGQLIIYQVVSYYWIMLKSKYWKMKLYK